MEPSVEFSWSPSSKEISCEQISQDSKSKTWKFTFPKHFTLSTHESCPCYIDTSIPTGRILVMEIIANSKNLESYSKESKQCLGGGELEPDWEYCETIRAVSDEQKDLRATAKFPPARFQSSTFKGHGARLKLLSIKPNKLCVTLRSVMVVVSDNTGSSSTITATISNSGSASISNHIVSATSESIEKQAPECNEQQKSSSNGGNHSTTSPPADTGGLSAEALRNMLTSAMFAVDAKINAACSSIETRIDKKLTRMEENIKDLKTQISVNKVESRKQYDEEIMSPPKHNDDSKEKDITPPVNTVKELVDNSSPISSHIASTNNKSDIAIDDDDDGGGGMVEDWNKFEVIRWLEQHQFQQYVPSLELVGGLESGFALLYLTADDLASEELGIEPEDVLRLQSMLSALSPSSRCSTQPRFNIQAEE